MVQPSTRKWRPQGFLRDKTDDVFERLLADHAAACVMHPSISRRADDTFFYVRLVLHLTHGSECFAAIPKTHVVQ